MGALPARFRRQRLLIVGCGDVGVRVARQLNLGAGAQRVRVLALTSSPERIPALRALGVAPLLGNLDAPATLRRLAGLATRVLHLAPPPGAFAGGSARDARTRALLRALRRGRLPAALVYGSTSGVYGDCGGALRDVSPGKRGAQLLVQCVDQHDHVHVRRAPAVPVPAAPVAVRPVLGCLERGGELIACGANSAA